MSDDKRNPLQIINEICTKNQSTPNFQLLLETHALSNEYYIQLDFMGVRTVGKGTSKKLAKLDAATKALDLVGENNIKLLLNTTGHEDYRNYIGELDIFCRRNKKQTPIYSLVETGPDNKKTFTMECRMENSPVTTATENRKKFAKQMSAKRMIELLNSCNTTEPPTKHEERETDKIANDTTECPIKKVKLDETLSSDNVINPDKVDDNVKISDEDSNEVKENKSKRIANDSIDHAIKRVNSDEAEENVNIGKPNVTSNISIELDDILNIFDEYINELNDTDSDKAAIEAYYKFSFSKRRWDVKEEIDGMTLESILKWDSLKVNGDECLELFQNDFKEEKFNTFLEKNNFQKHYETLGAKETTSVVGLEIAANLLHPYCVIAQGATIEEAQKNALYKMFNDFKVIFNK